MSWIVMDLMAALCLALSVCVAKNGAKTDPALGASIFCAAIVGMELFLGRKTFSFMDVLHLSFNAWFDIVVVGIVLAFAWLFLFMALKSGDAPRVLAMSKIYLIFVPVVTIFVEKEHFTRNLIFAIIIFAAGIVLIMVGSETTEWFFNILIAACFYSIYTAICHKLIERGDFAVFLSHIVALVLFLIISLIKRGGETFKSLTFAHGMLLILAGVLLESATLFYEKAVAVYDGTTGAALVRVNRLDPLFAVVIAIILFKDKLNAKKIGGIALITLAIEILSI